MLMLSKVYLSKGESDKAEALVKTARDQLEQTVKLDHPLTINKVETAWIECLNTREESNERTKEISESC